MQNETLQQLMARLPSLGSERLERSLDRCRTGFDEDLRTPLYDGIPRSEIIEICTNDIGFTKYEELTGIDVEERDKVGPFSLMDPYEKRRQSVLEYWHQVWNPNESALNQAVLSLQALVPFRSLRPDSIDTAFDLMPKDTSLGLPWLTRDRAFAADYLQRARTCMSIDDVYPCVLYWRGQPTGLHSRPKQRTVWGMDHVDTIVGATILYPLLRALNSRPAFSAWIGDWAVDEASDHLLHAANGRMIISSDYHGFDMSVPGECQQLIDSIWCGMFIESATPTIRLLGEICRSIPLVVPGEILGGRKGGIASGHVLTNMKGTFVNLLAGFYCAARLKVQLEEYMVLGDDSVFLFSDDVNIDELSICMHELGLEVSPDKQYLSRRSLHYLQRWHSLDYVVDGLCVGVHSPYRTLSGLTGYERFRQGWSKYMDTSRWIMQVENCRHDPRFRAFVAFLLKGDKILSSGMDPVEVFKRAGGAEMIRSVLNVASFPFNVKNPERVREFETTRVIRELQG
jgi:hypothetical protein